MKSTYIAVTDRLAAEVAELLWIDLEKGQMNFERPPIVFPAALVSITLPKAEDFNRTRQMCEAYITVKLCFDFTGNTSIATPEATRLASLSYFDLVDKVFAKLQGWGTTEMNPLSRVNVAEELRPDGYKVVKITFKTTFYEVV